MPNPRTPLARAKLTGADQKHPERYRDRSEPVTSDQPVGDPPAYLGEDAATVWKEAADVMGWLVREDRLALEIAANAVAAIRETAKAGDIVKAAQLTAARQALSSLGGTPVDRSKIHIPDDPDEDDPFAIFDA